MSKSNGASAKRKALKCPLNLHASGQFRKQINGRVFYFGTDLPTALERYCHERPYLEKGLRPPARDDDAPQLRDLCNSFLTFKKSQLSGGEITGRTFRDYHRSCEMIIQHLGATLPLPMLGPQTLQQYRAKLGETRGPVALANEITRVRVLLNYACNADIVEHPIKVGEFKRPSQKALRRQRASQPKKLFSREEALAMIDAAGAQMRAMILLGFNGGLGNRECADLSWPAVNLMSQWVDYPRAKTGAPRRFFLWPETVDALLAVKDAAPAARKECHSELIFLTRSGGPWFSPSDKSDSLSREFRRLQVRLDIHQHGRGFYALRHTFLTVAEATRDFPAVRLIMGHVGGGDIGDHYREEVGDDRLQRVTDHVHAWLYGEGV